MLTESVENELKSLGSPKQAILCGIEAQACIAVNSSLIVRTLIDACLWMNSRITGLSFLSICSARHTIFWIKAWRCTSSQMPCRLGGMSVCSDSLRYCSFSAAFGSYTLNMEELKMCVTPVPQSDRPAVCSLTSEAEWSFSHHHRGCDAATCAGRQAPQL